MTAGVYRGQIQGNNTNHVVEFYHNTTGGNVRIVWYYVHFGDTYPSGCNMWVGTTAPTQSTSPGDATTLKLDQIQEYLDFNNGPGVQHVALLTTDISYTINALRKNGMDFLSVPDTYYDELSGRVGEIDEEMRVIKNLNILVDRDEEGYLLQLFSQPIQDRPTLFYEFIQRKGSRGFGQGNFQALFESIEREQERRGNL